MNTLFDTIHPYIAGIAFIISLVTFVYVTWQLVKHKVAKYLLVKHGYKVMYECEWGMYNERYDSLDLQAMRPIHRKMSIAPPWAKLRWVTGDTEETRYA